jgi:hypothetical protein
MPGGGNTNRSRTRDPEKLVLDLIGDGHRFSEKIARHYDLRGRARW